MHFVVLEVADVLSTLVCKEIHAVALVLPVHEQTLIIGAILPLESASATLLAVNELPLVETALSLEYLLAITVLLVHAPVALIPRT